ncbi:hypothetical protein FHX42_004428 [Saccharopolyspora lacisalsi]|uniref:WXG100 family type VII secretion target n=1 Tax=Halosaccharopolyspora lacisalsi TaxID=1000566 RepID=A0A839DZV6_9PSEU|nr:WXG100 family type VII secretion target [Halosaccharopolyspora lacisalsi]MBA8827044.1 hypothetical protein [Halosaccharopolyspora lacisalsi]
MSAPRTPMEPETLRRSAKHVAGNVGDDLRQVLETLRSALEAGGACWGRGEAGRSFAQNSVPNRDKLLDSLGKTGGSIGRVGANPSTAADIAEADDQQASGEFPGLQRQVCQAAGPFSGGVHPCPSKCPSGFSG